MAMSTSNLAALLLFIACFYGYHLVYFYYSRRYPQLTRKGRLRQAIAALFASALRARDFLLLVHQTRNMLMSLTFLASTSLLLLGFVVGFSGVWESIIELPSQARARDYPVLLFILTLGLSFFSFLVSLRHFSLLGFLVGSTPERLADMEGSDPIQFLTELFMRGHDAFTLGRRGFVYSVAVATWFFNPWLFMFTTVILTLWVALYDR